MNLNLSKGGVHHHSFVTPLSSEVILSVKLRLTQIYDCYLFKMFYIRGCPPIIASNTE